MCSREPPATDQRSEASLENWTTTDDRVATRYLYCALYDDVDDKITDEKTQEAQYTDID